MKISILLIVFIVAINRITIAVTDLSLSSFTCEECDFLVGNYPIDGNQLNVKPGDVICLLSDRIYGRITIRNIHGTEDNPIIIRNCGGIATIYSDDAFGMKFQNSSYFKLTGDGSSDPFGLKISTEKGFFLSMESFTTNFEISRIEIAGSKAADMKDRNGFAGIGIKTSPYEDCDIFKDSSRQAWVLKDIRVHNNYIHDTGGEGLYIGHGFYKGRSEAKCPDSEMRYSHSIKGVRIYENLIENVGFDGIQIKNADEDVKVYHNIVRNYGTKGNSIHNEGLFIGEGTTGEFYGNIIDYGTGNGCQIQGLGNLNIHDNVFNRAGENGIYASHGTFVVRLSDGYFNIHNNVINHAKKAAFVFYNDDGGAKKFSQNIILNAGVQVTKGAIMEYTNNRYSNETGTKIFLPPSCLFMGNLGIADPFILSQMNTYNWFVPSNFK